MNKVVSKNVLRDSKDFSFFYKRFRINLLNHPEWYIWLLSSMIWISLIINISIKPLPYAGSMIYCSPTGPFTAGGYTIDNQNIFTKDISSYLFTTMSGNLIQWFFMIVAMMFPLLNEPVRHVAFSVRRKEKNSAILFFLLGYTLIWSLLGIIFLIIPFFLETFINNKELLVNSLIKAAGFLLAAALVWFPGRPLKMVKCSQVDPIRINGFGLYYDGFVYGFKIGLICLNLCWVPMLALVLAHHNFILMFLVTIVLIFERYMLPHTSKLTSYNWLLLAGYVFLIGN